MTRFYSHPVFVYWYILRALSLLNIFKIQDQPCVRFVSFLRSINWCCWFDRSVLTRPFFRKLSLGYFFFKSFFNFVSELNQEKLYDKAVDISGNLLFSDWTRTVYQVNNWTDYRDGSLIIGVSLLLMISWLPYTVMTKLNPKFTASWDLQRNTSSIWWCS